MRPRADFILKPLNVSVDLQKTGDTLFFAGNWAKVSGRTNSNHKQFSIPSLFFFKFSCLICNNNVSIQQEI